MVKFIKAAKTKKMLQVEIDGKEEWTNTNENVYNFAKSKFKNGDELEIHYNEQDGMKFVTRVTGSGTGSTGKETGSSPESKYTCEDCGASLKDSRYKKCYTCNQKNPATIKFSSLKESSSKSGYYAKSPEESEKIKRLSILSSAAQAAMVVQAQVDANALAAYVLNLYDAFYKKVSE